MIVKEHIKRNMVKWYFTIHDKILSMTIKDDIN